MRPTVPLLTLCALVFCASGALAQDELYSRIKPLETAVTSGEATHDQQIELARLYIQAGRYYEASKIAARLLAADPNDAAAATLKDDSSRGLRQISDKKVAEAEATAKRSGASDADRLALANAYFDAGSYAAAADLYGRLPNIDRETRIRQARALAWSSQMDASERVYSSLLKEEKTQDLDLEYGRLLSWMGASRAAVQSLRDTYDKNHNESSAVALANALAWHGNREEGMRILSDYIATNPTSPEASALLTQLRSSPDIRIERISKLMEIEPYNLALRVDRARLLLEANRYTEALADVRFVREHTTAKVEGLDEIETQAKALRDQELQRTAERLKAIDINSVENSAETLSLAKAYTGLEDYETAARLYESYLKTHPEDTAARIQYARVLGWDRRYTASARQYEKLIEANPDRADLRLEYAQILSYDSDFAGAMQMFSSLTDLKDNPRANLYSDVPQKAHFNLGQIYRWYGWNDHAVSEQNLALELDNAYIPARQELDIVRHLRPTSTLDARYSYATDSNDFTMNRIDLTGEKWVSQRTGWNASIGRHTFEHVGDQISALAASAGVNYRWSDRILARANVGANFYDDDLGTRPFFGVGAQWMPNLQSRAAIDFNHYDLIYDVFTISTLRRNFVTSAVDPISINDFRGHYDYNSGGFLSWLGDASYGFISDDNKRAAAHGLVSFRIFKQPFVAIKADGRYLSYDFRTNRYWSPTDYKSLAGVLQVGQNVRDRFFWSAELKYGRSWEGNQSSDLRSYSANITIPVTDALDLVGQYGYGRSGRLDSILGNSGTDLTNYWQRYWFVGLRVKQLFSRGDRRGENPYYFDNRTVGSPIVPPLGETH